MNPASPPECRAKSRTPDGIAGDFSFLPLDIITRFRARSLIRVEDGIDGDSSVGENTAKL